MEHDLSTILSALRKTDAGSINSQAKTILTDLKRGSEDVEFDLVPTSVKGARVCNTAKWSGSSGNGGADGGWFAATGQYSLSFEVQNSNLVLFGYPDSTIPTGSGYYGTENYKWYHCKDASTLINFLANSTVSIRGLADRGVRITHVVEQGSSSVRVKVTINFEVTDDALGHSYEIQTGLITFKRDGYKFIMLGLNSGAFAVVNNPIPREHINLNRAPYEYLNAPESSTVNNYGHFSYHETSQSDEVWDWYLQLSSGSAYYIVFWFSSTSDTTSMTPAMVNSFSRANQLWYDWRAHVI